MQAIKVSVSALRCKKLSLRHLISTSSLVMPEARRGNQVVHLAMNNNRLI